MIHRLRDEVLIDLTGAVLCPRHGAQPDAEYCEGRLPCGCQVISGPRGVLLALAAANESCAPAGANPERRQVYSAKLQTGSKTC
jgi:hypothetical protein